MTTAGTDPLLALLPSPLLGPATWQPVAGRLRAMGWDVLVCPAPRRVRSPGDVLAAFTDALPPSRPLMLVPHSNAGLYVPALTVGRVVGAAVFVDAGLPAASGRQPLAPEPLRAFLSELADADGVLPPWTCWWDPADVAGLFPDADVRAAVERAQPRLPLSYFQQSLQIPDGWTTVPSAYVAFGSGYAGERTEAARRGWPTTTLPGGHLHSLVDPGAVATAVLDSLQRLGITRSL